MKPAIEGNFLLLLLHIAQETLFEWKRSCAEVYQRTLMLRAGSSRPSRLVQLYVRSVAGTSMYSHWSVWVLYIPVFALIAAAVIDQRHPLALEEEKEQTQT